MRKLMIGDCALALLAGSAASTQPYGQGNDHHQGQANGGGRHAGLVADQGGGGHWKRGQRMGYNDWQGARAVDYRQHHLRQPPRGYEWRESNGQYILAAVATGLIASIILNSRRSAQPENPSPSMGVGQVGGVSAEPGRSAPLGASASSAGS